MDRKRVIALGGIFLICMCVLCIHVYTDFKRKKSERIRQLIVEAESSLSNIVKSK
jgi:hypothetical protein